MGIAYLSVSNFPKPYLHINGQTKINITKTDIARAIVSIGKTHWLSYDYLQTNSDFLHYWYGLQPYLNDSNSDLKLKNNFYNLDASEKRIRSYHIGMGISKIISERILRIPYLQHVDVLLEQKIATITKGKKQRGDLAGHDLNSDWHIIEAKGKTYSPSLTEKDSAKLQASRVLTVNGRAPKTKSYCMTYIDNINCEITLDDPDTNDAEIELKIDTDRFFKFYYEKILLNNLNRIDSAITFPDLRISFSLFKLSESNFYIGVEDNLLGLFQANEVNSQSIISSRERLSVFSNFYNELISIGLDGLIMYNAELEPNKRLGGNKIIFLKNL